MFDFTISASIISILAISIAWWILFTLFTSRSNKKIAFCTAIIVLLFIPYIVQSSYSISAKLSRELFLRHASGLIQLTSSPMRIPDQTEEVDYCSRFTNESGQPINVVSVRDDGSYCGYFWEFYDKKTIFVPYKNLPDGKIQYWATLGTLIIGNSSGLLIK